MHHITKLNDYFFQLFFAFVLKWLNLLALLWVACIFKQASCDKVLWPLLIPVCFSPEQPGKYSQIMRLNLPVSLHLPLLSHSVLPGLFNDTFPSTSSLEIKICSTKLSWTFLHRVNNVLVVSDFCCWRRHDQPNTRALWLTEMSWKKNPTGLRTVRWFANNPSHFKHLRCWFVAVCCLKRLGTGWHVHFFFC